MQLPDNWRDLSEGVADIVHRVPAAAGDCIIFTEALTHGTLPWTAPTKRSTLFYKCEMPQLPLRSRESEREPELLCADNAQGCAWSADFYDPDEYAHYEDMTEEKLAVLEPPNAVSDASYLSNSLSGV